MADIRPQDGTHEAVRTEPPQGVLPSHAGILLTQNSQGPDVAAQVMQFAVDGYLTITPTRPWGGDGRPAESWVCERRGDPAGLDPARRDLFEALFAVGDRTTMAESRTRMARPVRRFHRSLQAEVAAHGLAHPRLYQRLRLRSRFFFVGAGVTLIVTLGTHQVTPPQVRWALGALFVAALLGGLLGTVYIGFDVTPQGDHAWPRTPRLHPVPPIR